MNELTNLESLLQSLDLLDQYLAYKRLLEEHGDFENMTENLTAFAKRLLNGKYGKEPDKQS